jgi:hypothetical protein
MPRWAREVLGAATAVALAVAVVAAVAASARSELMFRDGDSLVTTLVVRSLAAGQPQDWAMSTVLFLPETAVLALLTLFGLGITGTLALAGVVNLVALYGALRVAAGAAGRARAPTAGALVAFAAFALLALTDNSPSRDSLELASLLTFTTYYSATVVAVVLAVGLARRAFDRVAWGPVVTLGAVAAASVLTNPLFAVWATVPLGLVLAGVWAATRSRVALWLIGALVAGSAVGFAARMPLDGLFQTTGLIANTGEAYADSTRWAESLGYYGGLVAERWNAPWGAASVVLMLLLWGWCIAATVLLTTRRAIGAAVAAACGWVMPLLVVIGAVVLGTHAARYLQPVAFAPILGLVILPGLIGVRRVPSNAGGAPARRSLGNVIIVGAVVVAVGLAGGPGVSRIAASASAADADLDCVVRWVEQSGRIGAGQFWTVRLAKAHLDDPRALVQVDHQLRGYAWLVNRDDFTVGGVSFLVTDAQSPAFDLPGGVSMTDAETHACGRYTIHDFGRPVLPLGPQRS